MGKSNYAWRRGGMFALAALLCITVQEGAAAKTLSTEHYRVKIVTVADGLDDPWSVGFLPDGRMLVTEKTGRLRYVSKDGKLSPPVKGVPPVAHVGQGGLLDVAVDPDFARNQTIFFSFAEPGKRGQGTAVARAVLDGQTLRDVKIIFRQFPKSGGGLHFGSRLVIDNAGYLFITVGERGQRDLAQDPSVNRGQVIRINKDGSIPKDNPFVGKKGFRPEIWSYGHRNPQGAALHPETGKLWLSEHGARGGDEVNVPKAGRNYGWPVISYGRHYSGARIGVGTHKKGMEQPVHYWDPSIAPSGMTFYTGDKFPKWKGNVFVGALKYKLIARLELDGEKVVKEERILKGLRSRVRDVQEGPDGYIYVLTHTFNGKLLRLEPADK